MQLDGLSDAEEPPVWKECLIVDGNEAQTWNNSQCLDVPKEITFGGGKTAILRAKASGDSFLKKN
jgi:hypothetical protein